MTPRRLALVVAAGLAAWAFIERRRYRVMHRQYGELLRCFDAVSRQLVSGHEWRLQPRVVPPAGPYDQDRPNVTTIPTSRTRHPSNPNNGKWN